jgi:hypothetical protein
MVRLHLGILCGILYGAGIVICLGTFAEAQTSPIMAPGVDRILATKPLHAPGAEGKLTLYMRQVSLPSPAARIRYLYSNAAGGVDSDLIFYLASSPTDPTHGAINWIVYDLSVFYPVFSGDIVVPSDKSAAYVVLARSVGCGAETRFAIYDLDPVTSVASLPLRLDLERKEEWPRPSKALSEVTYQSPRKEIGCGVASIEASSEGKKIVIRGYRTPSTCGTIQTTFDPVSKQWSEIETHSDDKH